MRPTLLFIFFLIAAINAQAQHTYVMRIIDTQEQEDTVRHHLQDVNLDSTLTGMILPAITSGRLCVYERHDYKLTKKLSKAAIQSLLFAKVDTQIVVDPINHKEVTTVRETETDFDYYHKYGLLEKWDLDPATGKTNIQIVALAFISQVLDEGASHSTEQPALLLNYNDVQNIIARYSQYHPENTLASRIWNNYFLSDTPPSIIR